MASVSSTYSGATRTVSASGSVSGTTLTVNVSSVCNTSSQPWSRVLVYINGALEYDSGWITSDYTNFPMGKNTSKSFTKDVSGMSSCSYQVALATGNKDNLSYSSVETISLWTLPGQTYVTRSTNNSANHAVNSGDQAINTDWRKIETTTKSWAGDSFTFWVDKNNPDSLGTSAWPYSWAQVQLGGPLGTNVHEGWASHGDGADRSNTWDKTIPAEWAGQNIAAVVCKEYHNSAGNTETHYQWAGHYIQPTPTLDSSVEIRSKRFYTGTPSCAVYRLAKWNITSNGYGVRAQQDNVGSKVTTNALTSDVIRICMESTGQGIAGGFYFGDKQFNANYSLPASPLDFHSLKYTPKSSPVSSNEFFWSNWFNPRTGATTRLGYVKSATTAISVVSGTVDLPVIDKISASSGNGTTAIVEDKKHIWTNQDNVKITWKVDHSGNSNGWGYDIRFSDITATNTATSASKAVGWGGCSIVPTADLNVWATPYGRIDATSTATIQHDGITEAGVDKRVTVIPYITDSAGYKIFGEKTRSYVESPTYKVYKIKVPNTPTLSKWSNTLPAIDGVKDEVVWEATSPSSWGNVNDFTYGYKLRYKIGNDTAKADGYQWKYISTPTTTSTKFSGKITETYNRSTYTTCEGGLSASSYYSEVWDAYTDFQSAFSTKTFTISAKDPYAATTGTLTTPEATTLVTEIPYTFKCPQETINGNALIQSTKISIDGGTAKDITNPTYKTGTPNSLTGALTLTFDDLKLKTEALARGAHTIVITNEVATYFDSTTPTTNHVYFGTTTVKSNTLNVEVAELPKKPTLKTPNPQYYKAGGYRNFKFEWTAADWGCLDTTYNDRHYDFELLDPSGNVILSQILTKTQTNWSDNILMISPTHEGTYTFKIRQTTVVGSSDWATTTLDIQKAEEPDDSEIVATDILALPNWAWNLKINPGGNGSYDKLPTTMPTTNYWFQTNKYSPGGTTAANFERSLRTTLVLASQNLTNKTSTINYSIVTYDGTNSNSYTSGTKTTRSDITGSSVKLNGTNVFTQSGTASSYNGYSLKTGSITVNHNKDTSFGKTTYYDAMFTGSGSATIGGQKVSSILKGMALPAVPDSRIEGRYRVDLVLPTYKDTLLGTETYNVPSNYKIDVHSLANSKYIGDNVWYDYGDGTALTKEQIHEYDQTDSRTSYTIKIYNRDINGYSVTKTITNWTTINNGVKLDRNYTTNLDGYENGLYKILVTYERNYTAKTVREIKFFDVIPPEVKIYNSSYIISCTETSDIIPFQLSVDVYAGTDIHEVEYSMDYGKTWTRLSVTREDGAHRYFERRLELTWLDEIQIRAHGKNPVSEKTRMFYHEMPSDYKVWLSWNDRKENKLTEEFFTVYEYNYDELEDIFTTGELKLTIDNSMKITSPYLYAGFANAKTGEWVNMNSLDYNGVGNPEILANDGIHNTSITITKALLDRRDVVFRIGFKGDKDELVNDNVTFIPRLIQGSKNNILDINKIFSEYQDKTLKYHYSNGKIAVTQGTCTVTNNKDNSFTITRETKPDTNFIRRLSMSYKGADTKKIKRIKKL